MRINRWMLGLGFVFLSISCQYRNDHQTTDKKVLTTPQINDSTVKLTSSITANGSMDGEQLAHLYCSSCHAFPLPDLLDNPTWDRYILPRMGYMLGIYPHDSIRKELIGTGEAGDKVALSGIFPEEAKISIEDWKKIQSYYLDHSPKELKIDTQILPDLDTAIFQPIFSPFRLSPPSSTYVKLRPGKQLWLGDAHTKSLYVFNGQLKLQRVAKIKEGLTHLRETSQDIWLTLMGSFSPTDAGVGTLLKLPKSATSKPHAVIKDLQRPVHASFADLNLDGREDIVVCEFAKWTGRLAWWENTDQGYQRHILRNKPGAIKTYIKDINTDGLPDVISLFGQGDEGIFVYMNQGEGQFKERVIFSFPASYGSSDFLLFDWNGDGQEDILYTAGDNADYPPVIKPYHGIRIFVNMGDFQFKENQFIAFPGAYKAIPADFDLDGDLDLAAISFFPSFDKNPVQGFVWFENKEGEEFQPHTFKGVEKGRWITMDAEDWDSDGDIDLVLGALAFEAPGYSGLVKSWIEMGIPYVILENRNR